MDKVSRPLWAIFCLLLVWAVAVFGFWNLVWAAVCLAAGLVFLCLVVICALVVYYRSFFNMLYSHPESRWP